MQSGNPAQRPPHILLNVDEIPASEDSKAGGVLLFVSLMAGVASIMLGTVSVAIWFGSSDWIMLSMPLALLAIVFANIVLVVWWFLGSIDIRIHVIGLTLGVVAVLGWFVRSGEIQRIVADIRILTKTDTSKKSKRDAENQFKPEAEKDETNKVKTEEKKGVPKADGRDTLQADATQKPEKRPTPAVVETRKPEEAPLKTPKPDNSLDKSAQTEELKANAQKERAMHLASGLSNWVFRSDDILASRLFGQGKFKVEMRGANYRDFVDAVDRKDWLAAFNKLAGTEQTGLPPNREIDDVLYSVVRDRRSPFLIFVDKRVADLKAIGAREDWKVLIVNFRDLQERGEGGSAGYDFSFADVVADWESHPDGIGWIRPWNPTWDNAIVAIGSPEALKRKVDEIRNQLNSLWRSLVAKRDLGEIKPAEIEKPIRDLYEQTQGELRELVLNGIISSDKRATAAEQMRDTHAVGAQSFPVGSAEAVLAKFCMAMTDGNLTKAAECISPKAKGLLAQIRDGSMTAEKLDELKSSFAPQDLQLRPNRPSGTGKTIKLGNSRNETLTFTLMKEEESYLLREFTITKIPAR